MLLNNLKISNIIFFYLKKLALELFNFEFYIFLKYNYFIIQAKLLLLTISLIN